MLRNRCDKIHLSALLLLIACTSPAVAESPSAENSVEHVFGDVMVDLAEILPVEAESSPAAGLGGTDIAEPRLRVAELPRRTAETPDGNASPIEQRAPALIGELSDQPDIEVAETAKPSLPGPPDTRVMIPALPAELSPPQNTLPTIPHTMSAPPQVLGVVDPLADSVGADSAGSESGMPLLTSPQGAASAAAPTDSPSGEDVIRTAERVLPKIKSEVESVTPERLDSSPLENADTLATGQAETATDNTSETLPPATASEPAASTDASAEPLELRNPMAAPPVERATPDKTPAVISGPPAATTPSTVAPPQATPRLAIPGPVAAPSRSIAIPRNVALMRRPIEQVLRVHIEQRLNANDDSCWSMMHSFLGWGPNTMIELGGWRKRYANAIEYVASNKSCAGRRLFYLENGRIKGREGPGYQGHPAQFLAMLAQCNVRSDYPLHVNGRVFKVTNLIHEEQRTCREDVELTFKAIAFAHYLDTETRWTCDLGKEWNLDKIIGIELAQPVNGAACGGTHRLMAISYAVAKRRQEGRPLTGNFANAQQYISDYHRYTKTLANRDGTFSSDWFKKRSRWGDVDRGIQTTGHIAEWLIFSLPEESMFEPHVVNSVSYLTRTLQQHRHHEWEVGPKGHAIRALRLYHQRVFQKTPPIVAPSMARAFSPSSNAK